ncbi:MAG: antibiotic biosynthesis monooxygenase [Oscillibacter sp.]|nr:antibiotic biosynthesis monooxygenase [Oscillibacter sp.]
METTLTLYVRYLAKPGCRENFLRQLTTEGIIDAIRREDGCLRYDYFLSVQNADEILLVEQWQTEEKQQAHLRAPHMDRLRQLKSEYVDDAQLGRVHLD